MYCISSLLYCHESSCQVAHGSFSLWLLMTSHCPAPSSLGVLRAPTGTVVSSGVSLHSALIFVNSPLLNSPQMTQIICFLPGPVLISSPRHSPCHLPHILQDIGQAAAPLPVPFLAHRPLAACSSRTMSIVLCSTVPLLSHSISTLSALQG